MKGAISPSGWKSFISLLLPFMIGPVMAGSVWATTMIKVSLEELTWKADQIVVGTAQESWSQWDDAGEHIFTYTRFTVDQVIKGDTSEREVTVKTPGGELDGTRMEVPSSPNLKSGGKYILFLYDNADNYESNVVGWQQGRYTIDSGLIVENGRSVDDFIGRIRAILEEIDLNER
jgi:hypothetical protein